MKKILLVFAVMLMSLTSCGLYQMVTYPQEIKDQGGEISREVTTFQYELMDGDKITSDAIETQSYLYLYKKDGGYFWNIRRSEYEVKKSFYPQDLTLEMFDFVESKSVEDKYTWVCEDVITGEQWTLVTLPWQTQDYGYFYVLSKVEDSRMIVYSVHIKNIITH